MNDLSGDRVRWGKTRVEALSDAVFAIAMTLLVLDLKVPSLPRHVAATELWNAVKELGPTFFSYFITFVLSGIFWFLHHRAFHEIKGIDGPLFAINLAFLAFVSLLPFSTAMLGSFSFSQPVSQAFYFGNLLGLGVTLNAFWIYAKSRHMVGHAAQSATLRRYSVALAGQPIACVFALAFLALDARRAMTIYAVCVAVVGVVARRMSKAARRHRATGIDLE